MDYQQKLEEILDTFSVMESLTGKGWDYFNKREEKSRVAYLVEPVGKEDKAYKNIEIEFILNKKNGMVLASLVLGSFYEKHMSELESWIRQYSIGRPSVTNPRDGEFIYSFGLTNVCECSNFLDFFKKIV